MRRLKFFSSLLLCCVIGLVSNINTYADETTTTTVTPVVTDQGTGTQQTTTTVKDDGTVQREVITTQTPAPQEVVTPPSGFTSCETVAAGWQGNIWVPSHQVCKYTASAEGVAWVEGYWGCDKYTGGECTNWVWTAGHWVKTLSDF